MQRAKPGESQQGLEWDEGFREGFRKYFREARKQGSGVKTYTATLP